MPPNARQTPFSLNPMWPHYFALGVTALSITLGFLRWIAADRFDPMHCEALLSEGQWLDGGVYKNWQPEGCMMHAYQPHDASICLNDLGNKDIIFIGDSVTRQLFFHFAHTVNPNLPTGPADDGQKHVDHQLATTDGIHLSFYWDPFLNLSLTRKIISPPGRASSDSSSPQKPALLVLGSGLWYLRYSDRSGGLPAWESVIEATINYLSKGYPNVAEQVVVLPVEEVVSSKLSPERASSMHSSDIEAMNSDLLHRVRPLSDTHSLLAARPKVSLPLVFNQMLDPSQTEDGLHFSDLILKKQADILLNMLCNDVLPKTFPLDKTCCRRYPLPPFGQILVVALVMLWGPYWWYSSRSSDPANTECLMPPLVFGLAIAVIFVADRTGLWLKEQKQFSPWSFGFMCLCCLALGLGTMKRADKDLGFLNREQTDEWKGWMQIAILIYHYCGASKISGVYNPIRVLVASYLFMTGYGHTTFYIKKADFGFLRIAQVLVRINLFTILLAYTMNTDYISYYFSPLVSMWFLIIYATMAIGKQLNDRSLFLGLKILASMGLVTWFMHEPWLLDRFFEFLENTCAIHWSSREWAFRVNLDLWIVYFGMLSALAVIKIREWRLTEHPRWLLTVRLTSVASVAIMIWFFAFELAQESKFTYNTWHPYVSFLPIAAFVVLRNANVVLRSASSRAFAFIGTCSLETFIIQYHLWLAGDSKGVLLVIPGTRWRPVNIILTSIMFIYISHRVAEATGEITTWICGGVKMVLPTSESGGGRGRNVPLQESIPLVPQSNGSPDKETDAESANQSPRWIDRLVQGSSVQRSFTFRGWFGQGQWKPGLKTKLGGALFVMWVLNVLWPYPPASQV